MFVDAEIIEKYVRQIEITQEVEGFVLTSNDKNNIRRIFKNEANGDDIVQEIVTQRKYVRRK